ncbi:MAG: DUF1573 domain-containing protein [Bacteroidales bacterium]
MKTYSILLLFVFSFFCSTACKKKINIIENRAFLSVLEDSKKNEKPIFLIVGGGSNCIPCVKFKKDIRNSKLLNKYKDHFLFYSCNVNIPENKFLHKVLLPFTVPNYYLIQSDGSVLSFSFYPLDDERIDYELTSFLKGNTLHYEKHHIFQFNTDSILRMQSLLMQANLKILSKEYMSALDLVNKSIEIHSYFYNNFLKYQIFSKLKDTLHRDSLSQVAYQYLSANDRQSTLFEEDIKEMEAVIPTLKNQKSIIEISRSEIYCKIKANSEQTFRVKFSNTGNYPIVILNVNSTCGCIQLHWSNKPVLPNDTSNISISFRANKDAYGKFEQKIKIYSNAINSPSTIKFHGTIY